MSRFISPSAPACPQCPQDGIGGAVPGQLAEDVAGRTLAEPPQRQRRLQVSHLDGGVPDRAGHRSERAGSPAPRPVPRKYDLAAWPSRCRAQLAVRHLSRIEPVLIAILVDHGSERADFLDAFARRYAHIAIDAQPSPVVQTILRDKAQIGRDVIPEPSVDLLGCEILSVRMSEGNIERLDVCFDAIGDADSANSPCRVAQPLPRSAC